MLTHTDIRNSKFTEDFDHSAILTTHPEVWVFDALSSLIICPELADRLSVLGSEIR